MKTASTFSQAVALAKALFAAGFDVVPSDLVLKIGGLEVREAKDAIAKAQKLTTSQAG